jgi:hypothetical protein
MSHFLSSVLSTCELCYRCCFPAGTRVCKHDKWACDVKIFFRIGKAHDTRDRLWYFRRTVRHRYMPPAQHLYDYGRVGGAVRGGLGVSARGKSMLKPLLPTRQPPRWVGQPARFSCCVFCLPATGKRGSAEHSTTNSVNLTATVYPVCPVT